MNWSDSTSITSVDRSFRSIRIARRSRVNSLTAFAGKRLSGGASIRLSVRNLLPSWVRASTKSQDPAARQMNAKQSPKGDLVRTLGPRTDAGPVVEPEPRLLRLLPGNLEPLPPPYPLDPLRIHGPTGLPKERRDPAVAVASVLRGERYDVRGQRVFIGPPARHLPPGRPMLSEHATGEPLRDAELPPDMVDAGTAAGGAQNLLGNRFAITCQATVFPRRPRAGSASRASDRRRPSAAARSASPTP